MIINHKFTKDAHNHQGYSQQDTVINYQCMLCSHTQLYMHVVSSRHQGRQLKIQMYHNRQHLNRKYSSRLHRKQVS